MRRSFRFPLVFAAAFGVLAVASSGCGSDEDLGSEEDAGNDSGLSGGGRRTTSSSSSGESSSSSSGEASSSSSGGSSSGGSSSSSGGSSSGELCDDNPDVPDYASGPQKLQDTTDAYDTITTINGILTPGDEDAYKIAVVNKVTGNLVPELSTTTLNVELCMYIACQKETNTVSIDCHASTRRDISTKIQGCCGNSLSLGVSGCGTLGDVNAYFVIKNTGTQPADQCKEYNINYLF